MSDSYKLIYDDTKPIFKLDEYENVNISEYKVYLNVYNLIDENPNIKNDNRVIIHLVNSTSGFGSQITLFMQNSHYFNEFYPNVICLPHFSKNNNNFKYHDNDYNNSFFLYYKKRLDIHNLMDCKQYVLQLNIIENYTFFSTLPVIRHYPLRDFIEVFFNNYEFRKSDKVEKIMYEIKRHNKPLFGIHIRSLCQKRIHCIDYLSVPIQTRLNAVKETLDNYYNDYSIFVMTDVQPYIEMAESIFKNVYYFENIKRIDNDYADIIYSLNYDECGYKLGMDILTECFAMSMCDKIFVSNSNIPVIISTMNPNIVFEEY